jgi:glutaredoxin
VSVVTLYGKPGCHLCEEARDVVEGIRAERDFHLEEVDVSLDPGLHREYGERIPVVAVDGEEAFQYHVDRETLLRMLPKAAPPSR